MSHKSATNLWVTEIHNDETAASFKVEKTLFSGQSPFQRVDVIQTSSHGIMLLNDGLVMLSERDEFIYHEMIAHVPLFVHPEPRRVLIIGGGDGGTAREVLRHSCVKRCVMVEIDQMVVDACKAHIPSVACGLDDERLELLIQDGVKYLAETKEEFDIVLVDSTDPVGPATPLFNAAFYADCARVLGDDGILVTQAESPFYDLEVQRVMLKNQRPSFTRLYLYLFPTTTYPGGLWSFGFASQKYDPTAHLDAGRIKDSGLTFRYYSPQIHKAAFVLPTFLRQQHSILDPV